MLRREISQTAESHVCVHLHHHFSYYLNTFFSGLVLETVVSVRNCLKFATIVIRISLKMKKISRKFPGCPVVRTLYSHCQGLKFYSWRGN